MTFCKDSQAQFPFRPTKARATEEAARALKFFAIFPRLFHAERMTQPLALVLYERLLPGSQLVNRLQDLNYRVQTVTDAEMLVDCAEQMKPMLVLADLDSTRGNVYAAIGRLKKNPATKHLPVIAFTNNPATTNQAEANSAGVTLMASETAILNHLPELLEQALQLE